MTDGFRFDLKARRTRLSDGDLVAALQSAAAAFDEGYFSTTQYDSLAGKRPCSSTIINRFGSWKRALALIGVTGVRQRRYSPELLIANLEKIWKDLGFPPGKRKIAKLGEKISERPYINHWGSVNAACMALAAFHNGEMSEDQLLAGNTEKPTRKTIPLKDRWAVLKRDNYRCTRCGRSPSSDHSVELEVDHDTPLAKGGRDELDNLRTLCRECNQGKKDR